MQEADKPLLRVAAADVERLDVEQPAHSRLSVTTKVGVGTALSYALSYFWRYPIFLLPKEELAQHVVTVAGRALDLQACFSMAFILGFGAAKMPMALLVSSPAFYRRRGAAIGALLVSSMVVECGGVWLFRAVPGAQVACVFVSSFLSSGIYGAMFGAYLEGRQATETLLALVSAGLIYAGNLARGSAAWALARGVPPYAMPLVVGGCACPVSCLLLAFVHAQPPPSAADVAARSRRAPMSAAQRRAFVRRFAPGLACMLLGYALLTGVRSFRDFYAAQIFAASLGVAKAPGYLFFLADLPGSVLACAALVLLNSVGDNRRALRRMCQAIVAGAVLLGGCTLLFRHGALGGVVWQMTLGVGIFVTYSVYGAPFFDRLVAASQAEGTATFLVFLADFCGYCVTIGLLLLQNFGPAPRAADGAGGNAAAAAAAAATVLQWYAWLLYAAAVAIGALSLFATAYFTAAFKLARPHSPAALHEADD